MSHFNGDRNCLRTATEPMSEATSTTATSEQLQADHPVPQQQPTNTTTTQVASDAEPESNPQQQQRKSGSSSIGSRIRARNESRASSGSLPSRYSDFEVGSVARQPRQKADSGKPADQSSALSTEESGVDPADELEMMLAQSGELTAEPAAKPEPPKKQAPAAAEPKRRSSRGTKRKTLVEGRKARTVKRKFSLEQEMDLSDELQRCLGLLNGMFQQDDYFPFYYPVDPVRLNIPDYFDVIKHPISMTNIREKLLNGTYADAKDFAADVHLMFTNARTYNPPGHAINQLAERLEAAFDQQIAKLVQGAHTRRITGTSGSSLGLTTPSGSQTSSSSLSAPSSSQVAGSASSTGGRSSRRSGASAGSSQSKRARSPSVGSSGSSDSDSGSGSDSSGSDSSDDDSRRRRKHRHRHRRHRHSKHGNSGSHSRSRKRSRTDGLVLVPEKMLADLKSEVKSLKMRLQVEQEKNEKAAKAAAEKAQRAEAAAAKRSQKQQTPKRAPLSFDTAPDPDRPVTEEDKRRISGNINRLPAERMMPLVSFVQDQLPSLGLMIPGQGCMMPPSRIEVDLDTFDNRTLRTIDHKVRQALALAGQARRRAERRMLEMEMHKEQQRRHHSSLVGDTANKYRIAVATTQYQRQVRTPQQMAMDLADSLRQSCGGVASPAAGAPGAYPPPNPIHESECDDEAADNEPAPHLASDTDTSDESDSSSDSSDGEDDEFDDIKTFAPPPAAPQPLEQFVQTAQPTAT